MLTLFLNSCSVFGMQNPVENSQDPGCMRRLYACLGKVYSDCVTALRRGQDDFEHRYTNIGMDELISEQMDGVNTIKDLPEDVIRYEILPFLDVISLNNVRNTSKFFRECVKKSVFFINKRDLEGQPGIFSCNRILPYNLNLEKVVKLIRDIQEKLECGNNIRVIFVEQDGEPRERFNEETFNKEVFKDELFKLMENPKPSKLVKFSKVLGVVVLTIVSGVALGLLAATPLGVFGLLSGIIVGAILSAAGAGAIKATLAVILGPSYCAFGGGIVGVTLGGTRGLLFGIKQDSDRLYRRIKEKLEEGLRRRIDREQEKLEIQELNESECIGQGVNNIF